MLKKKKLVYGVGVNDADYAVYTRCDRKKVACPFYVKWHGMLERCYSAKSQLKQPTYIGCSVCDEWLLFSNFKRWMEAQNWRGKELDKDLIFKGNKVYSPETCAFVDKKLNQFTNDRLSAIGDWPTGVSFNKRKEKLESRCQNHLTKKNEYLGNFNCPQAAHLAWKKRKHEIACQLADLQTDDRVAAALRVRYL